MNELAFVCYLMIHVRFLVLLNVLPLWKIRVRVTHAIRTWGLRVGYSNGTVVLWWLALDCYCGSWILTLDCCCQIMCYKHLRFSAALVWTHVFSCSSSPLAMVTPLTPKSRHVEVQPAWGAAEAGISKSDLIGFGKSLKKYEKQFKLLWGSH